MMTGTTSSISIPRGDKAVQVKKKNKLVCVPRLEYEQLVQLANATAAQTLVNATIKNATDQNLKRLQELQLQYSNLLKRSTKRKSRERTWEQFGLEPSHVLRYCSDSDATVSSYSDQDDSQEVGELQHQYSAKRVEELINQGIVCLTASDVRSAKNSFKKALRMAHRLQDRLLEAKACSNLASAYLIDSALLKSYVLLKESLRLFRVLREAEMECFMLDSFVLCCMQLHRYDEALGLALRKLTLSTDERKHDVIGEWIDTISRIINGEDLEFAPSDCIAT